MPKPGWGAVVQGEPMDLGGWAGALIKPFDPWIEIHGGETVLRSASLDKLASADEVRKSALTHIERLNGAFAVSQNAKPVRFGGVIQFAPDGKLHRTIFAEMGAVEFRDGVSMQAHLTLTGPNGQPVPPPPPQPSEVQRWLTNVEGDDLLNDALILFGKGANWFDMYKVVERLYQRAGGEHAFLALNWGPEKEIKRLKRTADRHRHARHSKDRLENPMSLNDARALLGQLLGRALREAKT